TVIIESTVYPGATEDVIAPILTKSGFQVGEDIHVAFSPERIDPGNEEYAPREIPKVLGGVTPDCRDHAQALYKPVFDELVAVNSATEAELVKLLENTFRSVNIALINELAIVADRLDADIWNVVEGAATKPFGYTPFFPGPGLGGHCIPVDTRYLTWKAKQLGFDMRLVNEADNINRKMPTHTVQRITELLNGTETPMTDAEVFIVGVAYKSDVSDTRESPALEVMQLLIERGSSVKYHDPHVPELSVNDEEYHSQALTRKQLNESDCVVILTDHSAVDTGFIVDYAPLVFDARNATSEYTADHVHVL
ncbi:MAG: nucleotide sugar dehydrogenase, partial [Halobacteriaceae archaeon]